MSAINLDFDITSDLYFLKVFDRSVWGVIENSPAIFEITKPGFSSKIVKYFDKGKVTMFNSMILDGTCVDCADDALTPLSDGIYEFKLIGSPSSYFKELKYLKTDEIRMNMDRLYINGTQSDSPFKRDFAEKMLEIEFYIKGAEANLRWDREKEAGKLFEVAVTLVEQLKNCKYC